MPVLSASDSGVGSDQSAINVGIFDYYTFNTGRAMVVCGHKAGSLPAVIGIGSSLRVWLSGQGEDAIYETL